MALAFFCLSVVALLISSSSQLFANIRSQQAAISSNQQLLAQDAARTVSGFVQEKFSALETALWLTDLASAPQEAQTNSLQSLLGLQPAFRHVLFLRPDGQVVAQASRLSPEAASRFSAQLAGDASIRQHERYISPVYIDPLSSEPLVVVAIPAVDVFGEFQGTLVAEVNLKFMWDLVAKLRVGQTGHAYVVDRQGNLLAFGDIARVLKGENVGHIQAVDAFVRDPGSVPATTAELYTGIMGTRVAGSYVPLGTPDWAVVVELPWEEAYQGIIQNVMLSIGVILAIAILAGVLGMYLAHRLAVPLVNLMNTSTRIAAGERDVQAVVGGSREVASLATAFNSMTSQLRQSLEGLEQRVADRTADLQQALDEVEARACEQERLLDENRQQREMIREMSVPVLPVTDSTLVMPLVGTLDTERLRLLQDQALRGIERSRARTLILDITGVPIVDSQVAQGLIGVVQAARLLGAEVLLVGIRPEVAQAIVTLGLSLPGLRAYTDLRGALNQHSTSAAMLAGESSRSGPTSL
ncbi:MAG TPA: cache domain-containing protein [Roseiflexaceae bacterium]|nr:cache domain-containing protein [Roseiflexaceae bacterium]